MIFIDNLKNRKYVGHEIYVGRRNGERKASPLANPYKGDRVTVIEQYRQWLWGQIRLNPDGPAVRELKRIACLSRQFDIVLLCFCAPLPCHSEVIIRAVRWMKKRKD